MHKYNTQKGFTIVELLIVIVIIGILAALVIVAYGGIQSRAMDTSVQTDMRNFASKVNNYNAEFGVYPGMTNADLAALGLRANKPTYGNAGNGQYGNGYNFGYCVNQATNRWVVYAISSTGSAYRHGSDGGLQQIAQITGGGYSICNLVGVATTNPNWARDANNNTWASWLN